jgi:hypothetical protein
VAGTNPTNAVSSLQLPLLSTSLSNGGALRWPSVAGMYYWLVRSTNLAAGFALTLFANIAVTAQPAR